VSWRGYLVLMLKMEETFFKELKEKIIPYFDKVGGHEIHHTERVYNLAVTIAKDESVDLDIIRAAALLHDIARLKESEKEVECHAEEGSKMAEEILKKTMFPKEKIKDVVYAIKVHRSSHKINPKTKEAAVLQDADRLDCLGAIIIGRVFSFDGQHGIPIYDPKIPPKEKYVPYGDSSGINHFYEKVFKLRPETFHTKLAKELAKKRYKFSKEFVEEFIKEWNGER